MDLTLSSPVQYVPRVGPKLSKKLEKLGVKTVEDLLYYVPFRYNDYSLVSPIARVQPGEVVTVRGEVVSIKNSFTKTGKKLQQAKISDETGTLDVIWFNQMYLTNIIKPGQMLNLSGKVDWFGHTIVMTSPEYEIFKEQSLHTGRLVPVYSETEGLSSKWLRGRISYVLEHCLPKILDYLPEEIRKKNNLIDLSLAIQSVHFPGDKVEATRARDRLAFDELLILQLAALEQKRLWQTTKHSHSIGIKPSERALFLKMLPFELTNDQSKAVEEILADIEKPIPMHRLLEGDVGSGKTVVAATAIYAAVQRGFQAILMAPTQILAQQHYTTLSKLLEPQRIVVTLIMGGKPTGKIMPADVYVGTHALLSKFQDNKKVALVVIDEQQRFGVSQRSILTEKNKKECTPHLLTMTATPIPRTVAQTIYGNIDLSLIAQMPKGRQKVKTWVVPKEKRTAAYEWIGREIRDNHAQCFIVCPLIEESESLKSVKAVTKEFERLQKTVFPTFKLGLLHGRLKARDKKNVLDEFRNHKSDILVTTPVVEVGIDIPNATIMMIEDADRFGLSQLHQLRGRVGRSTQSSYCLLFTEKTENQAIARLKSLETVHNGPELAEIDLTLRGPGELFGTKQHGVPELTIAHFSDRELVAKTQVAARELTENDPGLVGFPLLRERVKLRTIQDSSVD